MCELLEKEWCEGVEEGRKEGRKEGEMLHLINQVVKKCNREIPVESIADALEEEEAMVERILLAAAEAGSDEAEEIYACL